MKNKLLFFSLLLFFSCTDVPISRERNQLQISNKGFEFKLFQRNSIEIPSDSNNVFCYIDDITAGQTQLTIVANNLNILNTSIESGGKKYFELNERKYSIECTRMVNKLIGEDYAWFKVNSISSNSQKEKNETKEIESLLLKIENSDVTFIRNGTEHTGKEAADHLRSKWEQSDGKIKTIDSFILMIASKSTSSGKPYLVQLKDGTVMSAEDWYRNNILK